MVTTWLWIPITLWAAFAQTLRNAAQRNLSAELGTLGATSVRFIYGLPFAIIWLLIVREWTAVPFPSLSARFWMWIVLAAFAQIVATALLVRVMRERNFALGVAYSKTEVIQVAVVAAIFLSDPLTLFSACAVLFATAGVLLMSATQNQNPLRAMINGWTAPTSWLGLGAGSGFALAAVGFRGATLALGPTHFLFAAAITLVVAQTLQSLLLGAWIQWREPGSLRRVARAWRGSLLAGFMGAAATAGWFSAMTIEPVAHVRTLGLVELFFSLAISHRFFSERMRRIEWWGMASLAAGVLLATLR